MTSRMDADLSFTNEEWWTYWLGRNLARSWDDAYSIPVGQRSATDGGGRALDLPTVRYLAYLDRKAHPPADDIDPDAEQ